MSLSEADLSSTTGRQARYAELLDAMNFVLEWITDMRRVSPGSIAARELVSDFTSIMLPLRETHEKLLEGRLSWNDEWIPELLEHADGVRVETLRIIYTTAFLRSLSDGLEAQDS